MKLSSSSLRRSFELITLVTAIGCAPGRAPVILPPIVMAVPGTDTIPIPLPELGSRTYHGLIGGLFPGGSNLEPADHDSIGIMQRNAIRPLSANGIPSASGRYVLMSVGSAGISEMWCSLSSAPPCNSWSLTGRAASDPTVNHSALVVVNGAIPNARIQKWSTPKAANYDRIRDTRLAPLGLSENQVQAIWMNLQDSTGDFPLAASAQDASAQLQRFGATVRALKQRYPNLKLLFLASGRYHGYVAGGEPRAYESGFIVKWVIESQIQQLPTQQWNSDVGDLSAGSIAPWISWGPYLWTRGDQPRADGWSMTRADLDSTGTRFSQPGEAKMGALLLEFFKSSRYTRCWFLAGQICG